MARWMRAFGDGFMGGRASLAAAAYLYAAALAWTWTASAPLASKFHGALDGQPGARRLVADGGIEVIEELQRSSPGSFASPLAAVLPLLVLFLPVAFLLVGGAHGVVAERRGRPWKEFWIAGAERLPAFLARGALGAAYAAAVVAVALALCAGIAAASRAPSGPTAYWLSAAGRAALLAFAALHARTVLGFAFALREAAPAEGSWPGFLRSLAFCSRRPLLTHGLSAAFLALQALAALGGLSIARLSGEGRWAAAGWTQAGWIGVAWLRVAEIRARIACVCPEPRGIADAQAAGPVASGIPSGRAEGA